VCVCVCETDGIFFNTCKENKTRQDYFPVCEPGKYEYHKGCVYMGRMEFSITHVKETRLARITSSYVSQVSMITT
jgi:hypothetical protein